MVLGACLSSPCSIGYEFDSLVPMSKDFRLWKIDQPQLLPPCVQDFVPKDHLSRFIVELVRESVDLTAITGSYRERAWPTTVRSAHDGGAAARLCERHLFVPAHPQGVRGAHGLHDDRSPRYAGFSYHLRVSQAASHTAGRAVRAGVEAGRERWAGAARPCRARRHQAQGECVQAQGDELCPHDAAAGRVAGARSIAGWRPHEAADSEDDKLHGSKTRRRAARVGADKQKRIAQIGAAKAELEAEAKAAADEERRNRCRRPKRSGTPHQPRGRKPAASPSDAHPQGPAQLHRPGKPHSQDQAMASCRATTGRRPSTGKAQIIVAHALTEHQRPGQLVPLLEVIEANLGRNPTKLPPTPATDRGQPSLDHPGSTATSPPDGQAPHRAKRPSPDTIPGCDKDRRGGTKPATDCESRSSRRCSGRSSRHAASASSCCAASQR